MKPFQNETLFINPLESTVQSPAVHTTKPNLNFDCVLAKLSALFVRVFVSLF